MDIGTGGYPAENLSNFIPYTFTLDGVECVSMEGFLQSLKFSDVEKQRQVCLMEGREAKFKGKRKKWYREQLLYWKGREYARDSQEYQDLLDRAYSELYKNENFRKVLKDTGKCRLTHTFGKRNKEETVLTESEFVSRLVLLRKGLVTEIGENVSE